jgi:outer membrane protein OmpA-like peptidoglycan-associated protein
MTRTPVACPVFALALLLAAPASAQMYPGQGITVNPGAVEPTIVRLPDGRYAQIVAGPVGPYGSGTIHLHPPSATMHRHHVALAAPDITTDASAEPMSMFPKLPHITKTASTPPAPKKKTAPLIETAQTPPQPIQQTKASPPPPDATNDDGGIPLTLDPSVAMPIQKTGPKKPPKQAMAAAQTQVASIAPTPPATPKASKESINADLTKRGEILFAHDAVDPSDQSVNKMRALASDLNTLISAGATRVQLDAYGGAPHDKSSDARRISLKRALAVRQLLIEDGVSPDVIDVRAMGGSDIGAPDRVDIFIHA